MGESVILSNDLNRLVDAHPDPLRVIGADKQVLAVNQAFIKQLGLTRDSVVGKPCCAEKQNCRHAVFFQQLQPYSEYGSLDVNGETMVSGQIQGFPLLTESGRIFLGESIKIYQSAHNGNEKNMPTMLGRSSAFVTLTHTLQKASRVNAAVLLNGETGTGKELAAEFIHQNSSRRDRALVVVDCTSLGADLFESEVFGHEKGAFTGADRSKKGLIEIADQGTLFLDEVGELPLTQQAKLLRVLETGQFRRVGGTALLRSDVRVISATHRNLSEMVRQGAFREDLYFRLSVFPIRIPPLRERKEDIPLIFQHFLSQLAGGLPGKYKVTQAAWSKVMRYDWPGNIRELRNVVQLAGALCEGGVIKAEDFQIMSENTPPNITTDSSGSLTANTPTALNPLDKIEAEYIQGLIQSFQGNRKKIAEEMNISERTLYRKLKRYQLN